MRSPGGGGCTPQQALAPEAASVVKQAVALSRRRGHAQVTPLHVASAMLSSGGSGLLRAACLRSHSHPLQCKALELCFNVALNRLPASSSAPTLIHHHHHHPSLSNALVAAFKRAQANQRRGGAIDTQQHQQQLVAVKIELDQLVVSILDDPSVSRVMREAGFSSTQVKTNVENHSGCLFDIPPSAPKVVVEYPSRRVIMEDDDGVASDVVEAMASRRNKSVAIVAESLSSAELAVKSMMERVERGRVPEELIGLRLVDVPIASFATMARQDVEMKLTELGRRLTIGPAALYLGDLAWATEYLVGGEHRRRGSWRSGGYCPVEHAAVEIGRLVNGGGCDGRRIWLVGIATHKTYSNCKFGYPSLESLWGLFPLAINPHGISLRLSIGSMIDTGLPSWLRQREDFGHQCPRRVSSASSPATIVGPMSPLKENTASPKSMSSSLSEAMAEFDRRHYRQRSFKEISTESLKTLCSALERSTPRHKEIVPGVASAILRCRSGMVRRKKERPDSAATKEDTWLMFQGSDADSKARVAEAIASVVFGSAGSVGFVYLGLANSDCRSNKRSRIEIDGGYFERFFAAVRDNPRRVFFLDGVDRVGGCSRRRIRMAMEQGKVRSSSGEEAEFGDAVVVLSCERLEFWSTTSSTPSPETKKASAEAGDGEEEERGKEEEKTEFFFDLNICADAADDVDAVFDDVDLAGSVDRVLNFDLQDDL